MIRGRTLVGGRTLVWACRLVATIICLGFAARVWLALPGPGNFSRSLGVPVEAVIGDVNQYLVYAEQGSVKFERIGTVHLDLGYAVGVILPDGRQVGFRYATEASVPTAAELSTLLGVRVEAAPNEPNQFILRASPGTVDLSTLGTIHTDVGYAVGVTLASGIQIGFRFVP